MSLFIKKHTELSLHTPECTSLAQAAGFNKKKVKKFFGVYESRSF